MKSTHILRIIRRRVVLFMVCLFLSGITAIPLETELRFLNGIISDHTAVGTWLQHCLEGILYTNRVYPFMGYGGDWLAFAHIVLALLFIGVLRDPVRNKWVVEFGMIACILVIPFAFTAGYFRGIPLWWRLVDSSFGVFGFILLTFCYRPLVELEKLHILSAKLTADTYLTSSPNS